MAGEDNERDPARRPDYWPSHPLPHAHDGFSWQPLSDRYRTMVAERAAGWVYRFGDNHDPRSWAVAPRDEPGFDLRPLYEALHAVKHVILERIAAMVDTMEATNAQLQASVDSLTQSNTDMASAIANIATDEQTLLDKITELQASLPPPGNPVTQAIADKMTELAATAHDRVVAMQELAAKVADAPPPVVTDPAPPVDVPPVDTGTPPTDTPPPVDTANPPADPNAP